MLVVLSLGIGKFGKRWTGSEFQVDFKNPDTHLRLWEGPETAPRRISNIVDACIIERTCECGRSTRKFRLTPVDHTDQAREALDLPKCFITAGGVGSIHVDHDVINPDCLTWNWAGRLGGHVIINPLMALSGRIEPKDLPIARPGYRWACTYHGQTLGEYVLVPEIDPGTGEESAGVRYGQALPVVRLKGTCPPCRQEQSENTETVEGERDVSSEVEGTMAGLFEAVGLDSEGSPKVNTDDPVDVSSDSEGVVQHSLPRSRRRVCPRSLRPGPKGEK